MSDDKAVVNQSEEPKEEKKQPDSVNLNQKDATIKKLRVAAGWDLNQFEGESVDVDLSCFILGKDGETRMDEDFVFYNNLQGAELAVRHLGDNRNGFGDLDDEAILIDINALPYDVYKLVFTVSIYFADERDHDFSMVPNSFIRVVNEETDEELMRDDMSEKFQDTTAVVFCELERLGTEWHFRPIHKSYKGGLGAIAKEYGIHVSSIG